MTTRPELRDELLKDCSEPREVLAEGGLIKQLTKTIIAQPSYRSGGFTDLYLTR